MAILKGIWKINAVLSNVLSKNYDGMSFTSNGVFYDGFYLQATDHIYIWYKEPDYANVLTVYNDAWVDEAYRLVDFGEGSSVTDAFYEWFITNAKRVSIAEMLTVIAQNEQKVYDAGFAKGASADYEDGQNAAMSEFWDTFQRNGTRTDYRFAFAYGFDDTNFKPKYDMIPSLCERMFASCRVTDVTAALERAGVVLDTSNSTNIIYMFASSYCKRVPPISAESTTSVAGAFGWSYIETIDKLILKTDGTNTFGSTFNGALSLVNITIEGVIGQNINFEACKTLSADSIRSIIEHLSDTASGKTLTLSKTAVGNADFSRSATIYATVNGATNGAFILPCNISLSEGESLKVTLEVEDGHHFTDSSFSGNYSPDEWYVGLSYDAGEPSYKEMIIPYKYTSMTNGQAPIYIYFITGGEASFKFKVRAVKIDADGKEIDGENLYSVPDGSYEFYDGIGYTLAEESWELLQASKPNWTISLV